MKSTNFSGLIVAIGGFLWIAAGFRHPGLEQELQFGIGCVLLAVALVILELGKWRRL